MRISKQLFRGLLLGGVLSLVTISVSFGQVITRVLSPDAEIGKYIPWYNPDEKIPQVTAPTVNVAEVLEEDRRTGRVMPRIGIKQNVNYTTNDGQLIKRDNYTIWNMTLYSKDAIMVFHKRLIKLL